MAAPSNTLTGTTGNDILSGPGSVATLVQGLSGNDTITLATNGDWAQAGAGNDIIRLSTASTITSFAGSIVGGDGNDSFAVSGGTLVNGANIGLNAGSDTITITGGSIINSTLGAGAGNDTITLSSASVTTSFVNSGDGADTINLSGTTFASSTLQAGKGQDRIVVGSAVFDSTSFVGLGEGTDSITFTAAFGAGTLAGGGLADTITFGGTIGAVAVYGDADGVTTEGTGTGGAADGADKISFSANTFTAATSVYGAGGNDTITFAGGAGGVLLNGGDGADQLLASGAALTGAFTVDGGAGLDTITLGGVTGPTALVLGGLGTDSITVVSAAGAFVAGSINGGDGNDTISFTNSSVSAAGFSALGTVNGGAGVDKITFNTTGVFTDIDLANITATVAQSAGTILNAVYEAGDSLVLGTGLGALTTVNFALGGPQVFVSNSGSFSSLDTAAVGSVGVFDSGDDLVIGVVTVTGSSILFVNVVNGDDMLKTTAVGSLNYAASNFGFTLAQSGGALTITFS